MHECFTHERSWRNPAAMEWEQEEIWVFVEGNSGLLNTQGNFRKRNPHSPGCVLLNNLFFKAPKLQSYDPKQALVSKFLLLGML